MPDMLRTKGGERRAHPRNCRKSVLIAAVIALLPWAAVAYGRDGTGTGQGYFATWARLEQHEIAALALVIGVITFAVLASILLVRTRTAAAESEAAAREQIAAHKSEVDRIRALLLSEPQVLVTWGAAAEDDPEIIGEPAIVMSTPVPQRILAFGTWLDVDQARAMDRAVEGLRGRGVAFTMSLVTALGRHVEAEGRAVGGRAMLRLRDMSGLERDLADITTRHQQLQSDVAALRLLIETLPAPVWARDSVGHLVFANAAYARAVEAANGADAVARGIELLDRAAREELSRSGADAGVFSRRLPAIVAGQRRILDVLNVPIPRGIVGIGIDMTEAEMMRAELARMSEANRRTLDQLSTGVAIFGADQRLTFYNAA
jgi:PAS domain-containing protein